MASGHEPRPSLALPRASVHELVERQQPLVERVRLAYGATGHQFHRDVMPLLHGYAAYVHALPAAFGDAQAELGGLLRTGLEAGLYCLQGAESRIFTGHATITERRHAEPRWRMAALLAGLCCELHTTACWSVRRDGDAAWPHYRQTLASWLQARPDAVHAVTRSAGTPGPALNAVLLIHVVPPALIEDLGGSDGEVLAQLLSSLGGWAHVGTPNVLAELARSALTLVAARASSAGAGVKEDAAHGSPVARFGLHGLRELAAQRSNWQINAPRSRMWWGTDGLFVRWPEAAEDLTQLLLDGRVAGIPLQPPRWLALLCASGALAGPPRSAVVPIQPPAAAEVMQAVRIACPDWLLDPGRDWPAPLDVPLRCVPLSTRHDNTHSVAQRPAVASDLEGGGALQTPDTSAAAHPPHPHPCPQAPVGAAEPSAGAPAEPASAVRVEKVPPSWELRAPLRLAPRIREVLQAVLPDVQAGGDVAAWRMTDGIFIAADEWTIRGIPPHSAARALHACGMAIPEAEGGTALIVRRTPIGEQVGTLIGHAWLHMGAESTDHFSGASDAGTAL